MWIEIQGLELKILEHLQVYQRIPKIDVFPCAKWVPPLLHQIKINVDAAWSSSKAAIAAVARDQHGLVLKAWAIQLDASDSLVAETTAIRWALELASLEKFRDIIIESDAKPCIDALLGDPQESLWKISSVCFDIHRLALKFVSCSFVWAKREANEVAHELAKLATPFPRPFICFQETLPPSVMEAWQRDVLSFSSVSV
uniref:RNase H type-1 domain-containing protein n=1 Tax=Fagus sylvatica TaxID=28930 RepID=A0A2N9IL60_FAGSY